MLSRQAFAVYPVHAAAPSHAGIRILQGAVAGFWQGFFKGSGPAAYYDERDTYLIAAFVLFLKLVATQILGGSTRAECAPACAKRSLQNHTDKDLAIDSLHIFRYDCRRVPLRHCRCTTFLHELDAVRISELESAAAMSHRTLRLCWRPTDCEN
mgnify:CR=1 FL=1